LLTPGVLGGFAIYFSVRTFRHMAVLPSSIAMIMVIFYLILWVKEMSVEEATEYGWINKAVDSPSWYHTWDYLQIDKVVWRVLPSQTLTTIAMISVVALSSSLDIAAIEIEMKRPLDYNHELKTVGISNIVSGLAGGYTGSYIFSQTIFSLRMGIRSPLMGYVIAFLSLVTVVLPFNVLAYIPNLFFGSLLMMICLDLLFEWLIDVREKVTPAEYVVVLMSFCLLLALGVEFGILAGICLYVAVDKMGFDVGKGMQHPDVVVERPPS
jgi:SulP family sulfate permease